MPFRRVRRRFQFRRSVGKESDGQVPSGPKLKFQDYQHKAGATGKRYPNWDAKCAHHVGCHKTRGSVYCQMHGVVEPACYLAAWNDLGATLPKEVHSKRATKPSQTSVDEWFSRLGPHFVDALLKNKKCTVVTHQSCIMGLFSVYVLLF